MRRDKGHFSQMAKDIEILAGNSKLHGRLIPYLETYRQVMKSRGRTVKDIERKIINFYKSARKRGNVISDKSTGSCC